MNIVIQHNGVTQALRGDSLADILRNDIFFEGDLESSKGEHNEKWATDTGLKDYPYDEKRIKIMSPEEYINECAALLGTTFEELVEERYADNTPTYAIQMAEGERFNTPVIDYKNKYQDGIHRAMACMLIGEKEIPVLIWS